MVSTKVAVTMTPEMRADAAMLAVCRRLAEIAEATLPGTLEDLDPEFLHDFRVAIRRTRSMLRELAGVLPAEVEDRARSDLRRVQAVTGPTRDLDVYLQDWDELVGGVALPALHAELMRRRAEAFGAMSADLRGEPFTSGWAHWRGVLDTPPADGGPRAGDPIGELAAQRVRKVYGRMVKLGGSIDEDSPAEDLHTLRKRGKELRYLLEIFGGLWPKDDVKPMVAALKGLQDVLGSFQDREVQADFLRGLDAADEGVGAVAERLLGDQAAARAEFAERFEAFASEANRSRVARVFG